MRHTYEPYCHGEPFHFQTFSFRSEGPSDTMWFLNQVAQIAVESQQTEQRRFFSSLFIETDPRTQECVVEFQSNIPMEQLENILRSDFEKRVMFQTFAALPAKGRRMERDYLKE